MNDENVDNNENIDWLKVIIGLLEKANMIERQEKLSSGEDRRAQLLQADRNLTEDIDKTESDCRRKAAELDVAVKAWREADENACKAKALAEKLKCEYDTARTRLERLTKRREAVHKEWISSNCRPARVVKPDFKRAFGIIVDALEIANDNVNYSRFYDMCRGHSNSAHFSYQNSEWSTILEWGEALTVIDGYDRKLADALQTYNQAVKKA